MNIQDRVIPVHVGRGKSGYAHPRYLLIDTEDGQESTKLARFLRPYWISSKGARPFLEWFKKTLSNWFADCDPEVAIDFVRMPDGVKLYLVNVDQWSKQSPEPDYVKVLERMEREEN